MLQRHPTATRHRPPQALSNAEPRLKPGPGGRGAPAGSAQGRGPEKVGVPTVSGPPGTSRSRALRKDASFMV